MCVILVLVYAHVCVACLQVLALVLTQGQRCLSMLSVLTDVRLQGRVRGLEASVHWRHTPTLYRMSTPPHTPPHRHKHTHNMHKHLRMCIKTEHTYTCNLPPTQTLLSPPPRLSNPLQLYPSPSALHHEPFGVSTFLFIFPSFHLLTVIN